MAAEVSLQPFRVLGVDAIIVFSDILIVAEAMGLPLDVPDSGPILSNPVRDLAAVRRLRDFDPERETRFVGDAIRAICKAAGPDVPVIGFAAAPWTLACYMIEGQTRGDISRAKQMLRERTRDGARAARPNRARYRAVFEIADRRGRGRDAAFRHLGGRTELAPSMTHSSCPRRKWFTNCSAIRACRKFCSRKVRRHLLESLAQSGADVLSVDWRTDLAEARADAGSQSGAARKRGPCDFAWRRRRRFARRREAAVEKTGGLGHILNLGHGILPTTPVANAKAFVEAGKTARCAGTARQWKVA